MTNRQDRVALITGASRGIGAAVAVGLAALGIHPILVARDQAGLEATDDRIRKANGNRGATLMPLDLRVGDDIDRMAAAIFERFGKLDILIGNAATLGGGLYPVAHTPFDKVNEILATNLAANWRLMRACEPLLKLAPMGRAVFTTCSEAHGSHPFYGIYAASKAGLEALVRAWAAELTQSTIRVNMVNPGAVATELRRQAFPGEESSNKTSEETSNLTIPEQVVPLFLEMVALDCKQHGTVLVPRR